VTVQLPCKQGGDDLLQGAAQANAQGYCLAERAADGGGLAMQQGLVPESTEVNRVNAKQ
jgi:hypothetical protein